MNDSVKALLRIVLPLGFGGLVLWLIYRGMDFREVGRVLEAKVHYGILGFSLVFGLVANVVRGLRWHLLVLPIVPEGEAKPRLSNAICTVLGSYAVNMGIPRAGELWRCAEYQRYEGLGFTRLLGTLVSDRLVDVLTLLVILVACFAGFPTFFIDFLGGVDLWAKVEGLLGSQLVYALIGGLVVVGVVGFLLYRRFSVAIREAVRNVLQGIMSIRQMPQRGMFLFYTLTIWLGYFGFFYTTFFAFPFTRDLPLEAGVLAFAMSIMSVVAPVQAGMGPWHFMVITTLLAYGVSREDAGAFALIVHTSQTLWITLIGLVAILLLPILNRRYTRASDRPIAHKHSL